MPRPAMDVNGAEYQAILRGREMYRRHGADYKDMMWAEDTLGRLEKKLPCGDYTDKDRADFLKVRDIHARVFGKAAPNERMPWDPSGRQDGHISSYYIWRTRGDDKVRGSHAANNGKVFSWDHAPSTGHPGGDFNCRCWAEPMPDRLEERKSQSVTFAAVDQGTAWGDAELAAHYRSGTGKDITLHEIGLLWRVIDHARSHDQSHLAGGGSLFERVERQVFAKTRLQGKGSFTADFSRGKYSFHDVVWVLGHVPIHGNMAVQVAEKQDFLIITAHIVYNFTDYFRLEAFNSEPEGQGTSGPRNRSISITGTKAFYIRDTWSTRLEAIIKKDGGQSRYRTF